MTSVSSSTLGPLSPGKVVSAAVRLYRDRFKMYVGIAAKAYLWILIPIYGWAKYCMYTGLISRLAVQELMDSPETSREAYQRIGSKLWSFLGLGLLLALIFIGSYFAIALTGVLIGSVIGGVGSALLGSVFNEVGAVIAVVIGIIAAIALIVFGLLWVLGRFVVAEVPLAVESDVDASTSIGRSWQLSKSSIVRIQFVLVATYLITLPILIVFSFIPQIAVSFVSPESSLLLVLNILVLLLGFAVSIVTLPFWQIVKGVLYYDLRSRREGIDLKFDADSSTDIL